MNTSVKVDTRLIAACGLYCGSCGKYKLEKCPGCALYEKASWCKIRTCCQEKKINNCSECTEVENVIDCSVYNNFMGKVFGFIFRSDRSKCIAHLKEKGANEFAFFMAGKGWVSYPLKKKT
jgi:hypothetical protein